MSENDKAAPITRDGPPVQLSGTSVSQQTSSQLEVDARKLIADYFKGFARRVVEDALNEATPIYWEKRAETFEAARRRPCDFTGTATGDELSVRDRALRETAQACRARAQLAVLTFGGEL